MQQTEKQMTARSSQDSIEEVYTRHDISISQGTYAPSLGYPFQYPVRWLVDPSQDKRIGLRSIDVKPPSMIMNLRVNVDVEEEEVKPFFISLDVTNQNSLKEILNKMSQILAWRFDEEHFYQFVYRLDDKNKLTMRFENEEHESFDYTIVSSKLSDEPDSDIKNFLMFLNQDVNDENVNMLENGEANKVFYNVWDRETLFVHASFSNANRHYLGQRGEMHDSPNKLYPAPTSDTTFYLRFTSNHITSLLPKYADYTIELSFILNYRNSIVLQ